MTVTRAAIWGIAALAGASLSQLSFIQAQTSPQPPASNAIEQSARPIIPPGENSGKETTSGSNGNSSLENEKSEIVNTTAEDKPDGGIALTGADNKDTPPSIQNGGEGASPAAAVAPAQNNATVQNTPRAESPVQLTPADSETSKERPLSQPASNDTGDTAPATGADVQASQPEPEPKAEPVKIDPKDIKVTVATWSGAYGEAQQRALIEPFTKKTGYDVKTVIYDGAYDRLEKQAGDAKWSVVDLNGADMIKACNDGLLERLDNKFLESGPNGNPASDDFLPGAIHECGIGSMAWSAVLVTDQRLEHKPASLKDFFDIGNFPGKRILPKQPRYSLELALMADGVAPEKVYDVLKTPQGQDRAFAKLSSIKDDITWWEDPADVLGRIVNKEAIMGVAFNGRAFMSIVASEQPLEIVWDHQIYTYDYWSIPRGAEFQDAAREFIGYATSPKSLAAQAGWLPYGPSRRSAAVSVGNHPELGIDMKPFLPTHADHFANALAMNDAFWAQNEPVLNERFAEWVQGRQLPPQKNAMRIQ